MRRGLWRICPISTLRSFIAGPGEAFGRFLETTNPMVLWMRMMGKAWSPWLGQGDAAGKRQIAKEG